MSGLFSITQRDGSSIVSILGIRLKMSQGLRLEHDEGGAYSMFDLIREHAGVPFCVREVACQHGWTINDVVPSDLRDAKRLMLCWNARYRDQWRRKSQVPCEIVGSPFVHYRRDRGIRIADDARGTVSFPAHATREIRPEFGLDAYCDLLRALPAEFQPVTVCLHPADIQLHHMDEEYHRRGFATACAALDPGRPFYEAFYDILRRHRFATSNEPGSYLFYAVEMGVPFFLAGELPVEDNRAGLTIDSPKGRNRITDTPSGKLAYDLFNRPPATSITEEQRDYVLRETGMTDCLSPEELALALRRVAVEEHYSPAAATRMARFGKRLLRHPLHAGELIRFHSFLAESARMLRSSGGR